MTTSAKMFLGRFTYNVDQKGRLAVPARFRESLSGTVILTRGIDPCLVLYPLESWAPLAAKVDALPLADPDARAFRRLMYAEAANLELDRQGRILLPPELRAWAGIEREAVIVGVNTSIEIWSQAGWQAQQAAMDEQNADFANRFTGLI
jgi:MraZ protein